MSRLIQLEMPMSAVPEAVVADQELPPHLTGLEQPRHVLPLIPDTIWIPPITPTPTVDFHPEYCARQLDHQPHPTNNSDNNPPDRPSHVAT